MFEVSVEETFAAGHALRGYRGKCENVHGHNYRVQLTIAGPELDAIGLLAVGDFNLDGKVNNLDIQPLLDLLGGPGQGSIVVVVPEPAALVPAVWALAALGLMLHRRVLRACVVKIPATR